MGPGRKICIVPYGTETTKAVVEGLNVMTILDFFISRWKSIGRFRGDISTIWEGFSGRCQVER